MSFEKKSLNKFFLIQFKLLAIQNSGTKLIHVVQYPHYSNSFSEFSLSKFGNQVGLDGKE